MQDITVRCGKTCWDHILQSLQSTEILLLSYGKWCIW